MARSNIGRDLGAQPIQEARQPIKWLENFPRQVEGSTLRGAAAGHVWISPLVDDSHDVMKTWKQCESHRACAWHVIHGWGGGGRKIC